MLWGMSAYPVTLYWIWPEILSSYLVTDQQKKGKNKDRYYLKQNHIWIICIRKMCSTERNRYFL